MKVYDEEIEVIAVFGLQGKVTPIKFEILDKKGVKRAYKVKVLHTEETKIAGKKIRHYYCSTIIKNIERPLELKFDIKTCMWNLFKI